jgi:hypothetical protein
MTRFARWGPWPARILLLSLLSLVLAAAVQRNYAPVTRQTTMSLPVTDGAVYAHIVDRVRAGGDYYVVAADEHRRNGYPTSPAMVFRQPVAAMLLAQLPGVAARWGALLALAAASAIAAREALRKTTLSPRTQFLGVLAIATGLANAGMPLAPYMHEVWASLLILLSLSVYQFERPAVAALLGLAACLFRELALPYLLAMALMDLLERRWRSALCWAGAAALFVVAFAFHLHRAAELHRAGDLVSPGWLGLGGWPFLLLTARRNIALVLAPTWVVASVVAAAGVGLAGCRDRWVSRIALIVLGYLAAVTVVGRPDNEYWGELWAPLLPLGMALAPFALGDLARQAGWLPARRPKLEAS